jgi:hypothetical protein
MHSPPPPYVAYLVIIRAEQEHVRGRFADAVKASEGGGRVTVVDQLVTGLMVG